MSLREQLNARLAEFDRRSAEAKEKTDAVHESWDQLEAAHRARPTWWLRSFFKRGHCDS